MPKDIIAIPNDAPSFPTRMTNPYNQPMKWMGRRGDRVKIQYAGHTGTIESNVYQRTVDYPDEWFNGHHVMLDSEVLVTLRWEQVETKGEH